MNAALKLVGSLRWILHGQMSKSAITRGTLLYFLGKKIVGRFRPLHGNSRVSFHLDAGARNRQHLDVDLMLIHDRDGHVTKILESFQAELRNLWADIGAGCCEVVDEFEDQEVFFEPNLHQVFRLGRLRGGSRR